MLQKERERLSRPLTPQEQTTALAALDAAIKLKSELLERRGGGPFADSTEIVRTMRRGRTQELS